MSKSSAADAEHIYREYRSHGNNGWGPFTHYDDPLRQSRLTAEIDRLISNTALVYADDHTLWLPSAWHAALFFLRTERYLKFANTPRHQLYRGHADPNWRLVSTWDRSVGRELDFEWTATTLYAQMLYQLFNYPSIDISSYVAIARHMGFVSKQIDWTVDPAVAIYFASQQSGDSSDGIVHMLQVDHAVKLGLAVWCPPPICERIYTQHGVFLWPPISEKLQLYSFCRAVRFPKPCDSHPFEVWRDGKKIDLLRVHPWLEKLANLARATAAKEPKAIHNIDVLAKLVDDCMQSIEPIPADLTRMQVHDVALWAVRVFDLYHWLFIFISNDGCTTKIDKDLAVPIIRSNYALTQIAAEVIGIANRVYPEIDNHQMEHCLNYLLDISNPGTNGA